MDPNKQISYRRFLKIFGVLVFLFALLFIGYQYYLSRHFRVVSTTPKTNHIAAVAPFLKINFNRQLSTKDLSVSSSYSIVKSYKVQGKTLVVNLKSPMTVGYAYYVKVNSVYDTSGKRLVNKKFSFTPKDIPWQDLSKDQQAALMAAQANRPRTVGDINFKGTGTLLNNGISYSQSIQLRQFFFNFDPKANSVVISNVTPVPHNRNSSSTSDAINFSVSIDSKPYAGKIDYSNLSSYIQLHLYDDSGSQVFDSGVAPQDIE